MFGHELTLHETNARGAVPVCECGWFGVVHPAHRHRSLDGKQIITDREPCEDASRVEYSRHLLDMSTEIARASERHLVAIGSDIKAANKTLQRRGRWGNP